MDKILSDFTTLIDTLSNRLNALGLQSYRWKFYNISNTSLNSLWNISNI